MNDKIYFKDKISFLKIYDNQLRGNVFWRESLTDKTKVEIMLVSKTAKRIVEALKD